jgi:hypothetical protein
MMMSDACDGRCLMGQKSQKSENDGKSDENYTVIIKKKRTTMGIMTCFMGRRLPPARPNATMTACTPAHPPARTDRPKLEGLTDATDSFSHSRMDRTLRSLLHLIFSCFGLLSTIVRLQS